MTEPKTYSGVKIGLMALVLFFVIFLGWAVFAQIESASIAMGRLVYVGNNKSIQHLFGGKVKEILVREGDFVEKGAPLIILDTEDERRTQNYLENEVYYLKSTLARLSAQIKGENQISFPDRSNLTINAADAEDIDENQNQLFIANRALLMGQFRAIDEKIAKLTETIETGKQRLEHLRKQEDFLQKEENELAGLLEKKLVSRPRYWSIAREKERIRESIAVTEGSIAEAAKGINEAKADQNVALRTAKQADAKTMTEAESKLSETEEKLGQTLYKIEQSVITAPISGTVINLNIHTISGVVKPGEVLMQIVPKSEPLQVEADLNAIDIKNVTAGQRAYVVLLPYHQTSTPQIQGVVTQVSADALVQEKKETPYYKIYVEILPDEIKKYPEISLYPGMPVEVMIVNQENTLLEYILRPITRTFRRAFVE